MKIAFDHQAFNLQTYGGISRYYTILAEDLLKKEQDVHVFAGIHRNNYLPILPSQNISGVKINEYPPSTWRLFQAFNHYLTDYQIKKWKPDIIHETYYSLMNPCKSKSIRVTSVYDMIHELFPQMFSASDNTSQWKRNAFARVDHIISISHSTKKDLVELFGIDEDKISVVHLGVDISSFEYSDNNDSGLSNKPYLLYVGARGGYKNFERVLGAMATSAHLKKDFDLLAFGGGVFTASENSTISRLGFAKHQIKQTGGDDSKLVELYHTASAFIYPSLYEGFGLPPLEAMACSCPVISSNTSSMPEVIGTAGEYFDPNSVDEIRESIERVVYSSSRIDELKTLGLKRAKLFAWDKCATETLAVYKKLVG